MYVVNSLEEFDSVGSNKIIGTGNLKNTKIVFKGENNILFLGKDVRISDSVISFECDNSVVYISESRHEYKLGVSVNNRCTLFIGKNNYINNKISISVSEQTNVVIGEDGMFSFGIWIRTADPHLIYDIETGDRINPSKGVFIGDHVWVGQNVMITKGSQIGSGSIIGAMGLVSGQKIPSNQIWGGVPVKKIKSGIFFTKECVHAYNDEKTAAVQHKDTKDYIYNENGAVKFSDIDNALSRFKTAAEKFEYIQKNLAKVKDKNRFFINEKNQNKVGFFKKMLKKSK